MEKISQAGMENSIPIDRVVYFEKKAQRLLNRYGKDFDTLIERNTTLLKKGDLKLQKRQCTGFNIVPNIGDMDLESNIGHIFYSNYIGRPHHFGTLLAMMEQVDGLIDSKKIKFGVKASKVRYGKNWKPDDENERIEDFKFEDRRGRLYPGKIDKSVETVVTFAPRNGDNVLEIINFLLDNTNGMLQSAIPGSWEFPDMRTATNLSSFVTKQKVGIKEVQANIIHEGRSGLIILRKSTKFEEQIPEELWRSIPVGVNEKLVKFLTYFRIPA